MYDLFAILNWPNLATVLIAFIIIYIYLSKKLLYWKKRGINGPKPVVLFGNMYSYFIRSQPEIEIEWYQKYGKMFGVYDGSKPILTVAEPELVKQILVADFHSFRNRGATPSTHPVRSKVMLFTRDDDWKRIRAITSPTFTSGKMRKMFTLIRKCCYDFIANLEDYAARADQIEIKKFTGAFTIDVIAKCAFATDTDAHRNPDNQFNRNAYNVFNISTWKMVAMFVVPSFLTRIQAIRKHFLPSTSAQFFIDVGRHIIRQRKDKNEKHNDFMQLLIDAERSDDSLAQNEDMSKEEIDANVEAFNNVKEKRLTENEILAQCLLFFLAGYESTASTIAFSAYELAVNPEVQRKLYLEIKAAFDECGEIDYETLLRLPYLDAVVTETLRKYPPLCRLERQAMDDFTLGDTGFTITKGTIVEIPAYAMHYDHNYFPKPFDFIPERFLPENRHLIKPYTYMPFGIGPRNCLGMRFALLEVKLCLFNSLLKFEFFRTANTEVPLDYSKGKRSALQAKKYVVGIKIREK